MLSMLIVVIGLIAFEVVSSLDNAVVNADVLATMKSKQAKRFFLTWGMFFAVFVARGLLPSLIVFVADPSIGLFGALGTMFGGHDEGTAQAIEAATPFLMLGGGIFLALLFVHWVFTEEKNLGLPHESKILGFGQVWFYAIASLGLLGVMIVLQNMYTENASSLMIATMVGATSFFITQGFKDNATHMEEQLRDNTSSSHMSDWAKVGFLEVLDLTFSIDGVVGAFAFTSSVPLILLGNGIGAFVVRYITIKNTEFIKKLKHIKTGAMCSIGILAGVMMAEGFGMHVPLWLTPLATVLCIGFFLYISLKQMKPGDSLLKN